MLPMACLVNAISLDPSVASLQALSEDDWERISVTAIATGLAPLLDWGLSRFDLAIPLLARAKLAVTRQAHAKRNGEIAEQLAEILAACALHEIPVITLKGALLAATAYPEAALRPMNDIDLLFRPTNLERVGMLLETLGYRGKHRSADQGPGVTKHLSTYKRNGQSGATPNPYLSAGSERMIEPHGSLEESWFGLTVDITPGVWERAVPITLHGQPTYRLAATDMVLHLAVHATFHVIMGTAVFVQLYDLGRVVETWAEEINWAELVNLADAAGAQPFLYAALDWAGRLYGISLPDGILPQLAAKCDPDLVSYVRSFDAAKLLARTQQPPLVTLWQRLRRGVEDRRETARWASRPADKWRVWQTAVAFHKTDTVALLKQKLKLST